MLAERLPAGAKVLVVGATGLIEAARERGFKLVESADDEPAAVVQGYGPDVGWQQLAEADGRGPPRRLVRRHEPGPDRAVEPRPAARKRRAGRRRRADHRRHPHAVGKPDPAMHRESVQRSGAPHPIVVGDRLDTDIEGAGRVGCDSLLVLTGVTTPADLLGAAPRQRPTYVARVGARAPRPAAGAGGRDR